MWMGEAVNPTCMQPTQIWSTAPHIDPWACQEESLSTDPGFIPEHYWVYQITIQKIIFKKDFQHRLREIDIDEGTGGGNCIKSNHKQLCTSLDYNLKPKKISLGWAFLLFQTVLQSRLCIESLATWKEESRQWYLTSHITSSSWCPSSAHHHNELGPTLQST